VEYDFDGVDDLDPATMESTPLDIIMEENHLVSRSMRLKGKIKKKKNNSFFFFFF